MSGDIRSVNENHPLVILKNNFSSQGMNICTATLTNCNAPSDIQIDTKIPRFEEPE